MNWLLLVIPAVGIIGIVAALPLVRKFAPLERTQPRVGNLAYPNMASGEVIAVNNLAKSLAGYGKVTVDPNLTPIKRTQLRQRVTRKPVLKKKA